MDLLKKGSILGVLFVFTTMLGFAVGIGLGFSVAWKPPSAPKPQPTFTDKDFEAAIGESRDKVLQHFGIPDERQINYDENNILASEEWRYLATVHDHISGEVKDVHVWWDLRGADKANHVYFRNPEDGIIIRK